MFGDPAAIKGNNQLLNIDFHPICCLATWLHSSCNWLYKECAATIPTATKFCKHVITTSTTSTEHFKLLQQCNSFTSQQHDKLECISMQLTKSSWQPTRPVAHRMWLPGHQNWTKCIYDIGFGALPFWHIATIAICQQSSLQSTPNCSCPRRWPPVMSLLNFLSCSKTI